MIQDWCVNDSLSTSRSMVFSLMRVGDLDLGFDKKETIRTLTPHPILPDPSRRPLNSASPTCNPSTAPENTASKSTILNYRSIQTLKKQHPPYTLDSDSRNTFQLPSSSQIPQSPISHTSPNRNLRTLRSRTRFPISSSTSPLLCGYAPHHVSPHRHALHLHSSASPPSPLKYPATPSELDTGIPRERLNPLQPQNNAKCQILQSYFH